MNTRFFLFLLATIVVASVQPAPAQEPSKFPRIGLIHIGLDHVPPSVPALRKALKELGYEEGKNIVIDWRNQPDEKAALATAKEFVDKKYDLIVAFEDQSIRAAKTATTKVPVVFLHASNPLADGFIESFSHPGGNMTGFLAWPVSLGKQVELFKELIPQLDSLLVLVHPDDPVGQRWLEDIRAAGRALKVRIVEREARNQTDIEGVLRSVKQGDVGGILVSSLTLRNSYSSHIIRLAAERRIPLGMHRKKWVERGALFSYSADLAAVGRACAPYIDKILKGADPAKLPVEQVSKFELAINLKTAKRLGLTIPPEVLYRADKLIE